MKCFLLPLLKLELDRDIHLQPVKDFRILNKSADAAIIYSTCRIVNLQGGLWKKRRTNLKFEDKYYQTDPLTTPENRN